MTAHISRETNTTRTQEPVPTHEGVDFERRGNLLALGPWATIRRMCSTVKGLRPEEQYILSQLLWNSDDEQAIRKYATELDNTASPIDLGGVRHFMRAFSNAFFHLFIVPDSSVREFSLYSRILLSPDQGPQGGFVVHCLTGDINVETKHFTFETRESRELTLGEAELSILEAISALIIDQTIVDRVVSEIEREENVMWNRPTYQSWECYWTVNSRYDGDCIVVSISAFDSDLSEIVPHVDDALTPQGTGIALMAAPPATDVTIDSWSGWYAGDIGSGFIAAIAWGDGPIATKTTRGWNGFLIVGDSRTYSTGFAQVQCGDDGPRTVTFTVTGTTNAKSAWTRTLTKTIRDYGWVSQPLDLWPTVWKTQVSDRTILSDRLGPAVAGLNATRTWVGLTAGLIGGRTSMSSWQPTPISITVSNFGESGIHPDPLTAFVPTIRNGTGSDPVSAGDAAIERRRRCGRAAYDDIGATQFAAALSVATALESVTGGAPGDDMGSSWLPPDATRGADIGRTEDSSDLECLITVAVEHGRVFHAAPPRWWL